MNKSLSKYILRRRITATQSVQQLWDAIKVIKFQGYNPTLDRIARYMNRTYKVNEEEVSKQLQNCVRDGLLRVKNKSSKGSKHANDQDVYELPKPDEAEKMKKDTNDWYCFTCHVYGDVILCTSCYRVYHCSCLPEGSASAEYVCDVCKSCANDTSLADLRLKKLNRILSFICQRLQNKYSGLNNCNDFLRRSVYTSKLGASVDISNNKEAWRVPFLVYKPFDLSSMKTLAESGHYRNVSEFKSHAQQVVHAIVVFHGDQSDITVTSRQMLRECMSMLKEMQTCPSCFERSVLKLTKNWFCKPCRPPHELVFAGSPYMPAKVLKEEGDKQLIVLFFGPEHKHATVSRSSTLPIDAPVRHLGQTDSAWSKAMTELATYKQLLEANLPASSSDEETVLEPQKSPRGKLKEKVLNVKETPLAVPHSPATKSERFDAVKDELENESMKRKRGRPRKAKASKEDTWERSYNSDEEEKEAVKRPRGRAAAKDPTPAEPKRKLGLRQRKPATVTVDDDDEEDEEERDEEEKLTHLVAPELKAEKRAESPTTTVSTASTLKKNEEEIVSSSCMEPQVRSVGTQTTNKDMAKLEEELNELRAAHALEVDALKEEIKATKKKQWCYNCELEAIYHCCWNTAYCSTECQQEHWQSEHKRICRRKR